MCKLRPSISIPPLTLLPVSVFEIILLLVLLSRFLTSSVAAASKLIHQFHRTGSGHFTTPDHGATRMYLCGRVGEETPLVANSLPPDESLPASVSSRMPIEAVSIILHIMKSVIFTNPLNLLLPIVPVALACGSLQVGATTVFILNFLAIVPLSGLLGFATEEIAARLGQVAGGLVNATFGNAVELIVRKIPGFSSGYYSS